MEITSNDASMMQTLLDTRWLNPSAERCRSNSIILPREIALRHQQIGFRYRFR